MVYTVLWCTKKEYLNYVKFITEWSLVSPPRPIPESTGRGWKTASWHLGLLSRRMRRKKKRQLAGLCQQQNRQWSSQALLIQLSNVKYTHRHLVKNNNKKISTGVLHWHPLLWLTEWCLLFKYCDRFKWNNVFQILRILFMNIVRIFFKSK